ncbi:choice-of-anchor G family protein [Microbacterium profundi]
MARRASTLSILSLAAALVVTNLTPVVVTSASWTDQEWDHGGVGTLSCTEDGSNFKTRGAGRLLGGEVLSTDLDSIAELKGITAKNDGQDSHAVPDSRPTWPDTYQNSLDVSALGEIEIPAVEGTVDRLLSSVLTLTPAPETGTGVVNQYANASDTGVSAGASGAINDSGVVLTPESGGLPDVGTIKLSTLVTSLTGQAISNVVAGITDLELEVGAVASRATLDACEAAWTGDIDSSLTREYAIAGLDASMHVPVVEGVSGALSGLLRDVQTSLDLIAGDTSVVSQITGGVGQLLGGVLGALSLANTSITGPTITVDPHALDVLAAASVSDKNGVVVLDLASGRVQVNLAALLGAAYSGTGFNGAPGLGLNDLPPNTELVVNGPVVNALTSALADALGGWTESVVAAVTTAILTAKVGLALTFAVAGNLASINVTVAGPLDNLTAIGGLTLLDEGCKSVLLTPIACILSGLVGGVTNTVTTSVGPLVAGIINAAIGESGLVAGLATEVAKITAPVVTTLSNVLVGVFGNGVDVDGLLSLRVNVQNDPVASDDPDAGPPSTYDEWEIDDRAVPDDQYDVAALSVSVIDLAGTTGNVNVEFARASVGVSCAVGGVWDHDERCVGY